MAGRGQAIGDIDELLVAFAERIGDKWRDLSERGTKRILGDLERKSELAGLGGLADLISSGGKFEVRPLKPPSRTGPPFP